MFGDPHTLFANSTRPSGSALAVDGGFRVSGQWSLVSGCELADWIPVMCLVTRHTEANIADASSAPEMRMAYLQKGSYRILDTWHVGGLRGTGSHDIVAEDVFVLSERTFSFLDPKLLDRPLYRMPLGATLAAGGAAICLGIAQTAIEALLDLAASQGNAGPGLRDHPAIQAMVAVAGAEVDAARLLIHTALDDLWTTCNQGLPITDMQRVRAWAGAFYAAKTAKEVVTAMYEAAGAAALYVDCPLERAHRDIYAARQHVILGPKWLQEAGRVRLGLKATNPLF